MKILTLVLSLGLLLAALACAAPVPTPIPTPTPVPTATPDIPATVTARLAAIPTATPYPTLTPWPTATPRPTHTPYPTPTTVPTATPYPTSTPYPTPTALPTYTPYPTATPDIRYQVVTPTPEPTRGPLTDWQKHSPRTFYSISLPSEFVKGADVPFDNIHSWGVVVYGASEYLVTVAIDDFPNAALREDLVGMASLTFLGKSAYSGYYIDVLSFAEISPTVLRGSYRMTGNTGYCDMRVDALFVRGDEHTYRVAVAVCESIRWKYGEDFPDRVLNSFTY